MFKSPLRIRKKNSFRAVGIAKETKAKTSFYAANGCYCSTHGDTITREAIPVKNPWSHFRMTLVWLLTFWKEVSKQVNCSFRRDVLIILLLRLTTRRTNRWCSGFSE